MIARTGWTWEYVARHMDLHRYAAMVAEWRRSPPLQQMIQAYLGIEPQEPPSTEPLTPEQEQRAIGEFMRNFAAAGGLIN